MTSNDPLASKPAVAPASKTEPAVIGLAGLTVGKEPLPGAKQTAAQVASPAVSATGQTRYPITFTGSGSEYFRIWIVNLLLTIITLGIYHPWAAVRKRRYFYNNTLLAGHSFDFHGKPLSMLRGYALMAVLFVLYSLVSRFSPFLGLITLLAIACLYPALVWAGQRFRLSQTSWRGLRFAFTGSMAGAYKALVAPAVLLALGVGLMALGGSMVPTPRDKRAAPAAAEAAGQAQAATQAAEAAGLSIVFLGMAVLMVCWPLLLWSVKRYQHQHLALGAERSSFDAGLGAFYGAHLKASLLTLLVGSIFGVVVAVVLGLVGVAGGLFASLMAGGGGLSGASITLVALLVLLGFLAFYLVMVFVPQPFITSRLQNVVWGHTKSAKLGFESKLRFRTLLGLGIKNWLLIVLTLGLYWPFAAIATAKARLEAVTVLAPSGLDAIQRGADGASRDATGEAAVDLFGVDIGM